jgi:DNA-3-methyladenine glycosylase II
MANGLIETAADIDEGVAWLCRIEPRFCTAREAVGAVPLRRRPGGFAGLMRIVVAQQVSVTAAEGIWRRVEAAGADRADRVVALSDEALRACGLSGAKARCLRAVAAAGVDYDSLATRPEGEARAVLTALPGIGPWSADIYLMFCVGLRDVFAPGDLALRESARLLFDLDERPDSTALAAMAEPWSPWRGVAARLLWAYYAKAKQREGVTA